MAIPSGSKISGLFPKTDLASALSAGSSLSFPEFQPHPLVRGGNAQTILPVFLPGKKARYESIRHEVVLSDGDRVVLHDDCPEEWQQGDPVVLMMHGLTGCHQSHYMQRLASKINARGWRAFRMDHRGSGAGSNLARNPYHAALTHDGIMALQQVAKTCPLSALSAVGFSLSGNLLLKIAGTCGEELPRQLTNVMAICPAIDVGISAANLRQNSRRRYDRHFTRELWSFASRFGRIRDEFPHLLAGKRPKNMYEFDHTITAPVCGFESAQEYYDASSSIRELVNIRHETLIVAAADDPLIPVEMFHQAEYSPTTRVMITPSGGHLGFFGKKGFDPDRRWMDWRVLDWVEHNLAAAEKDHRERLPISRAA